MTERKLIMDYINHYDSPLGGITLAADGTALTGLWFDDQKYFGDTLTEEYEEKDLPVFAKAAEWLDIYFSGKDPGFIPPLSMRTTAFRRRVWEIMLEIPFGQTMTYGQIAAQIAKEKGLPHMSAQAVGGAVGHNSISLIIPCHRVVGTDGSLTGYAGGIDKKIALLELEGADMSNLYAPKKSPSLNWRARICPICMHRKKGPHYSYSVFLLFSIIPRTMPRSEAVISAIHRKILLSSPVLTPLPSLP